MGRHRGLGRLRSCRRRGPGAGRGDALSEGVSIGRDRQLRIGHQCRSGRNRRRLDHRVRSRCRSRINSRLGKSERSSRVPSWEQAQRVIVRASEDSRRIVDGVQRSGPWWARRRIVDVGHVRTIHHHRIGDRVRRSTRRVALARMTTVTVCAVPAVHNPLSIVRAIGNGRR